MKHILQFYPESIKQLDILVNCEIICFKSWKRYAHINNYYDSILVDINNKDFEILLSTTINYVIGRNSNIINQYLYNNNGTLFYLK